MPTTRSVTIGCFSKREPAGCGRTATFRPIFSGNFDPVTPPRRGEEVARYLSNSRHVIVPQAAHGVDGLTNTDCLDKIILEFIEKADAKDLDVSCIDRMAPPPFATK